MAALVPVDVAAPHRDCAAFGQLRAHAVDALTLDVAGEVPAALHDELAAWARELVAVAPGPALGVAVDDLPPPWWTTLAWSGTPLARGGALRWGVDLVATARERPAIEGARLLLPPCDVLAELSSPAIKPLREWIGQRLGCRLQSAPGLRLWLWADRALVVSCLDLPVGGFLYGPAAGSRVSLSIAAGGWQLVEW